MSEEVKAPRPPKRAPKKKVCTFCVEHAETIDYKDAAKLRRFTTEKGKILPRLLSSGRGSWLCSPTKPTDALI